MPGWVWMIVQFVGMVVYGFAWITALKFLLVYRVVPWWVVEVAMDAVMVPYWIFVAFLGFVVVDERGLSILVLVIDWILAAQFTWHAWRTYDEHWHGRWKPGWLSRTLRLSREAT